MLKQLILFQVLLLSIIPEFLLAQDQPFSLEECINYAWEHNTDISRANNTVEIQNAYLTQSKAELGPNLFLKGSQNLNSSSDYAYTDPEGIWTRNSNSQLSFSLSSEINLYNGAKLKNTIIQNKTNLASAETAIQTQKELMSLNILSAYINTLLAIENVNNYESQLSSISNQLEMAEARKSAGIISTSDYLNIKSQYAADKASLVEAENTLRTDLVALMQLMNMPQNDSFTIKKPDIDLLLNTKVETNSSLIYNIAVDLQPNIKSALLDLESAEMDVKIARADALPQISLGAGVETGYNNSLEYAAFGEQFSNKVNPYIGLSLSVPIYQRKKVKTNVAIAEIQTQNEELTLIDLKNDLRKYIEQACNDAQTSNSNYLALQEQYEAEKESYKLSGEMFSQGLINSVDFLTSKNNLVNAENKLTQAKYNVLLQNKIIDYYLGKTIIF